MDPEKIAYWFFRLNGCTTITNFVVHPDKRGSQRTDVDVLAVRFPHRAELLTSGEPMPDHPIFVSDGRIDIVFAEAKLGLCSLNGPWTNPPNENIQRVLFAVGAFEGDKVTEVADALYKEGSYVDETFRVRLLVVGERRNDDIAPSIEQLLWNDILSFIYERLTIYRLQKAQHGQWDNTGRRLYELANHRPPEEFASIVEKTMHNQVNANGNYLDRPKRERS